MEITSILTKREIDPRPFFHLVYEWEDVFVEKMGVSLINETAVRAFMNRVVRKLRIRPVLFSDKKIMVFEITSKRYADFKSRKDILPVIIDFYIAPADLYKFNNAYKKNQLVLVSSKEAVDFLKANNSPLNFQHLPLSFPDIYKIPEEVKIEKKWDLVLVGRQNPVLLGWLLEYEKKHPDFVYVYRESTGFNYYTNKGEFIGKIDGRSDYIALIRQSKTGLYSTPGMDGGEKMTKGFNQVTPRFLELIGSRYHVIARYPQNADTEFFQLDEFCESVESYPQFEEQMEKALRTEIPLKKYSEYMEKHYTSVRVEMLQQLLKNN